MSDFTIYENKTGKIVSTGSCNNPEELLGFYDNCSLISVRSNLNSQYVLDEVVLERPTQTINQEGNMLTNVAENCDVYVDGEHYGVCTSGEIVLDKVNEGDIYRIKLKCFPFLDYEVEV